MQGRGAQQWTAGSKPRQAESEAVVVGETWMVAGGEVACSKVSAAAKHTDLTACWLTLTGATPANNPNVARPSLTRSARLSSSASASWWAPSASSARAAASRSNRPACSSRQACAEDQVA